MRDADRRRWLRGRCGFAAADDHGQPEETQPHVPHTHRSSEKYQTSGFTPAAGLIDAFASGDSEDGSLSTSPKEAPSVRGAAAAGAPRVADRGEARRASEASARRDRRDAVVIREPI